MLNNKNFHPVSRATYDFLISNYGNMVKAWLDNIDTIILKLCEKWNISIYDYEPQSRFGCILYGRRNTEDIVLKLVPPCCPRLKQEIECYFYLPYSSMVELYAYDLELGGFLLKRIRNLPINSLSQVTRLLNTMYLEKQKVDRTNIERYSIPFNKSLRTAWEIINNSSDMMLREFLPFIVRAEIAYSEVENATCYLLHGDAHIHNILYDGHDVYLIDPIGFIGPFEIEYARFLGTYIRENDLYNISLEDLIFLICGEHCPIKRILLALGYDVTMRACNTFIEGNTKEEILDAICWSERIWAMIDNHYPKADRI